MAMEKVQQALANIPTIVDTILNDEDWKSCDEYILKVKNDIEYFKKHGAFPSATDEHSEKTNDKSNSLQQSRRTKRGVLNDNTQENIVEIKQERVSGNKLSATNDRRDSYRDSIKENVKIEKLDMPPPVLPVKKGKKAGKQSNLRNTRSTRTKGIKKEICEDDSGRDSDVVLQKEASFIINLDSDDENQSSTKSQSNSVSDSDEDKNNGRVTRSTRTKSKIKISENAKRSRSPSTDVKKSKISKTGNRQTVKRKKSDEAHNDTEEEVSDVEDRSPKTTKQKQSSEKKILNETFVRDNVVNQTINLENHAGNAPVKPSVASNTVVVAKPKLKHGEPTTPMNLQDIMTDDEDDNIVVTVPKKPVTKGSKPIFSPFHGSPVKKRVEAFEKLGAEATSITPVRTTRTKTRALAKNKESETQAEIQKSQTTSRKDPKLTPLMSSRCLPGISYSAQHSTKSFVNESLISTKSASALKSSQQEFRERELKRREKEADAIRKREALLHVQAEEKKKKREEKQTRAQQMREALERSKQKALEQAEKAKEEKFKQAIADKQEKTKRQQEEAERRRLEAMRKAAEEKRKEEERRKAAEEGERRFQEKHKQEQLRKDLEEGRKAAKLLELKKKAKTLPLYLRQKAPLLPTDDCYDSDHEEDEPRKVRPPLWMSRDRIVKTLRLQQCLDRRYLNSFFMQTKTPDLQEIFENIDPKKLKRTSSAVWRAPPRFTLMPKTIEEDAGY